MSNKASCTPDGRVQLLHSPPMAGFATAAARPGGPIEIVRELFAAGRMLARVSVSGKEQTALDAIHRAAGLTAEPTSA